MDPVVTYETVSTQRVGEVRKQRLKCPWCDVYLEFLYWSEGRAIITCSTCGGTWIRHGFAEWGVLRLSTHARAIDYRLRLLGEPCCPR